MSEEQVVEAPVLDHTVVEYVASDAAGKILYYGSVPAFIFDIQVIPDGGRLTKGMGTAETHYVKDGEVLVRPACPATLVGRVLENLPVPCTITIEGVVHDCTDDHCELEFSQPGTYSVRVSSFPWLDASFQVSQV